eukprot:1447599-Amphidinium_carterae.1
MHGHIGMESTSKQTPTRQKTSITKGYKRGLVDNTQGKTSTIPPRFITGSIPQTPKPVNVTGTSPQK